LISVLTGLIVFGAGATAARPDDNDDDAGYEVWVIDQSNTRDEDGNGTLDSGGTLYIYQGDDLTGDDAASAVPEALDLGGAARDLCVAQTGTAPVRPHMFFFNGGRSHAVIAFVATGHVLFMNTATKTPVQCLDVGVQAHAAVPSNDQTFIVVANQNARLLQRINTNYATNTFTLDNGYVVNGSSSAARSPFRAMQTPDPFARAGIYSGWIFSKRFAPGRSLFEFFSIRCTAAILKTVIRPGQIASPESQKSFGQFRPHCRVNRGERQ
jgi:hypothetical protein